MRLVLPPPTMLLMSYSNCVRVKVYIHHLGNRTPEGTVDSAQREFRDVLAKARGDDGARKRANIRALQSQLKEHWAPGSYNWRELERCLKVIS